ncbi:hypothetical protein [Mycobacterium goodii]|uniref:hypothetical protein n=1 Tax=Mycolicibacterium goodii TaxID=134601 RepID=UPI00194F088B
MGYQAARTLRDLGHQVIGVDLFTLDGRRHAADEVLALSGGRIHTRRPTMISARRR